MQQVLSLRKRGCSPANTRVRQSYDTAIKVVRLQDVEKAARDYQLLLLLLHMNAGELSDDSGAQHGGIVADSHRCPRGSHLLIHQPSIPRI